MTRQRIVHAAVARARVVALAGAVCLGAPAAAWASPLEADAVRFEGDHFLDVPSGFSAPTPYTITDMTPVMDVVKYALPPETEYTYKFSHWGPLTILPDGRVLSSLGDHGVINANSYLYEYNPQTGINRMVADLQSAVDGFSEDDFGFGKVHGRLNVGNDGNVYFVSWEGFGYRSSHSFLNDWDEDDIEEAYVGERLFRYNPDTEQLTDLGVVQEGWGFPSSHMAPNQNVWYGEGQRRDAEGRVEFFAYDLDADELVFQGGHEGTTFNRDVFVDADGNAYFNNGDRTLVKYDPVANELTDLGQVMPVSRLRRTTGPDANGIMYATSHDTDDQGNRVLFSFDPVTHETETLMTLWDDTPAMAMDPAGEYIYMAPGLVAADGRPIIRFSLDDHSVEVMAFLDPLRDEVDPEYPLFGTYSLDVTEDTVYIQFGIDQELELVALVIPEPGSGGLLALATLALLRRRRRC